MENRKDEALKTQTALRCAKAAILLASLKSSLPLNDDDKDQEIENLKKAVWDLKIEAVKQRMKNKRIKLCGLAEFVLMLFLWSFCMLLLAFKLSNR